LVLDEVVTVSVTIEPEKSPRNRYVFFEGDAGDDSFLYHRS